MKINSVYIQAPAMSEIEEEFLNISETNASGYESGEEELEKEIMKHCKGFANPYEEDAGKNSKK